MSVSSGFIQAFLAYTIWGLFPIYWSFLKHIPATELIAHRILWSFVLLLIIIVGKRKLITVLSSLADKKSLYILTLTAILISGNWLLYIWAVTNGHILESSFGYYISPLLSVLLGIIFLGEKLRLFQYIAVGFALLSVIFLIITYGEVPFISLGLACSMAIYALLRKSIRLDAQTAMLIETGIIVIPAILYILLGDHSHAIFTDTLLSKILLIGGGAVTLIPLILMTNSLKTLTLSSLGFLQYISPTLQFFCGLFIFNEPFNVYSLIGFIFIWLGMLIYSLEAIIMMKRQSRTSIIDK